jgi:glycosyltransferase involved in cell wall biosynthesis
MNILILHSSSDLYGASRVLLVVVKTFIDAGNQVTVILSKDGELTNELRVLKAEVELINLGIIRKKYYSVIGILNRFSVIGKAFFTIKKLVHEKKIDLIYSNTSAVLVGALVAKSTGKKHIWHVHEIIEQPALLYNFLGFMFSHGCDKVIVVSKSVYEHWQKKVPAEKLILVYNGFDYSLFKRNQSTLKKELSIGLETIIIGTIGRIHYWKGQDYFLEIAGYLSKKYPNIEFLIVGDAFEGYEYLYGKLTDLTKKLLLQDKVHLLGYRNDMANIYHSIDIFVLPSVLPDPFPTVILEAMASGIPVVATRQGGAIEMVEDNQTGILVPIHEPEKAALLMEKLIENKELRTQMGIRGKERLLRDFSLKAFNDAIINAIL